MLTGTKLEWHRILHLISNSDIILSFLTLREIRRELSKPDYVRRLLDFNPFINKQTRDILTSSYFNDPDFTVEKARRISIPIGECGLVEDLCELLWLDGQLYTTKLTGKELDIHKYNICDNARAGE